MSMPNPRWTVDGSTRLANTITGVCRIRKEIAEQIVAEVLDNESKTAQFETVTMLTGKPKLSKTTCTWTASKTADDKYRLELTRRTEA